MELIKLISTRQSVRKYDFNRKVERIKIEKCIEAARLAPSACNSQPWSFVVVDDPELSQKVARATFSKIISFNKFAAKAPVIVVIVIEKPKLITQIGEALKDREFPLIDMGIAAQHFCLQAHELGLGTCMMGWFDEQQIKNLLHIPEKKRIGLCISLGYEADNSPLRKKIRKAPEGMFSYNRYRNSQGLK